jgi:predicted esterase
MENQVDFNFTAHYSKMGKVTPDTKKVWFVLHGYGQLAPYFLKKFEALASKNICVIAPEGLSRFYLEDVNKRSQGGSQRVGASWMTKENRLMDIHNYLTYLNAIASMEIGSRKDIETTILGFSQGAATASRWAIECAIPFQKLILWAGIFPDDMDFARAHDVLHTKRIEIVYGTRDPFLTAERLIMMGKLTEKIRVEATVHTFDGAHEVDEIMLLKLV